MNDSTRSELAPHYDAFLSYSSHDRAVVRRLQRFLESYRVGSPKRRVRVYLDSTDIRGGELREEIRTALARSARLIVCVSPAALNSRWVAQEVRLFSELHGTQAIARVLIAGKSAGLPFLPGSEGRWHDLRRRFLLRFARPGPRIERLRLLAFVTNVDLRTLRNWRRRMARHTLAAGALTAALSWYPIHQWQPLVHGNQQRFDPIAAEVRDGRLWAAARVRAAGPQGVRNYILQIDDLLASSALSYAIRDEFKTTRRLLPVTLVDRAVRAAVATLDLKASAAAFDARTPVGQPYVGQTEMGRLIVVQPLSPTEDELDRARDAAADVSTPIPTSGGSLVVALNGGTPTTTYVPSLNPPVYPPGVARDPLSPAHGIAVARTHRGELWLGVRGVDGQTLGGLWHSADTGRQWVAVDGFVSVSSIAIRDGGDGPATVTVAESHLDRWRGISLEPHAARVVERTGVTDIWTDVSMPPFGTRSDVELCGELQGAPVVRVDEKLFVRRTVPLWRYVGVAL